MTQDLKDKISQDQGIKITDAIKEVKESLDKDADQLKPKLDNLKSLVNEVTTELYKNVQPPPGADQQSGGPSQENQQTSSDSSSKEESQKTTSN